jgi:hypothetical protein
MALTSSGNASLYPTRAFGPYSRGAGISGGVGNRLQVSLFCWARLRAAPSGIQSIFSIGNLATGTFLQIRADTNYVISARYSNVNSSRLALASSATNIVGLNEWFAVGATLDCTGDTSTARVFVKETTASNSASTDTSTTVFDNVTFFRRPTSIGGEAPPSTTDAAEAAVWSGLLSQAEFDALACGANPSTIGQGRRLAYFPLLGDMRDLSPVATWLRPVGAWTPTWRDHPPVQLPPRRRVLKAASGTTYNLTATGIAAGSSVGTPSLTQGHALAADGISAGSTVGTPALAQRHALVATGIAAASAVGTPTLGPVTAHDLTAVGVSAESSVGTPALTQIAVPVGAQSVRVAGAAACLVPGDSLPRSADVEFTPSGLTVSGTQIDGSDLIVWCRGLRGVVYTLDTTIISRRGASTTAQVTYTGTGR